MNKNLILLAIVLLFSKWMLAQNSEYVQDTFLVNNEIKKAREILNSNSASAMTLANKTLTKSKELRFLTGEFQSLALLGTIDRNKSNLDSALSYFKDAYVISKKIGKPSSIANTLDNIGQVYEEFSNYRQALDYYLNALAIREKNMLNNDSKISYTNIGYIYEMQKDFTKAKNYYFKSLKICIDLTDSENAAKSYTNIGNVCKNIKEPDSALYYFNIALNGYITEHDSVELPDAYSNIAAVYIDQNKYNEGIKYLHQAYPIAVSTQNRESQADILVNTADAYIGLKNYPPAFDNLFKAVDIAKEIQSPALLRDIYLNISQAYDSTRDYKSAYEYYLKYNVINDSLVSVEKSKQLTEMQTKYETDKKETDKNAALATASLRTRQFYTASISFAIILFLAAIIFLFYRQRVRTRELIAAKNEQIQNQKIDELLKVQEIKSFQSMIEGQEQERKRIAEDLHDGLGILLSTVKLHFSSIEDRLDKQANAQEPLVKGLGLLDEALNEVRRIAHSMSAGVLTNIGLAPALEDLKETIEAGGKMKVNLFIHNMEARLETITEIYIYRMIQELISNILKYAQATEISLNLNKDLNSNILTIIVEDDGIGFDKTEKMNGKGTGLKNIAARAERLNGSFNIDSNKGKGTTAIIEIPV